jgi:hypothetical protein
VKRLVPWLLGGVLAASWARGLVRCATARIGDADVWWIAAAGRRMLRDGRVPHTNGWSFVEPDRSWVMHEWVLGIPYALGLREAGPAFFALTAAATFVVTGAIVAWATVGRARHAGVGCALAFVSLVLFAHPTARPAWVALAFPALMTTLAFRDRLPRVAAFACVVLELVWVNAHGSFPLGPAVLFAAALASADGRPRRLATAVAAAAVTLVNPYGLRLHALVVDYAGAWGSGANDLGRIVEYAPIWDSRYFGLVSPLGAVALGLLAAVAVDALAGGRHRARSILVLAVVVLAARHARNAPVAAVVASITAVPAVDDLVTRLRLSSYLGSRLLVLRSWVAGAVVVALAVAGIAFGTVGSRSPTDWIDASLGGASFVRLASRLPDGASAFAPFRSAGLLLWLTADRGVRVFYDPRNDCYSPEMRHVGLTLAEWPLPRLAAELDARGARFAVVPSPDGVPVSLRVGYDGALAGDPAWSVLARDGAWALYGRSPAP